MTQRKKSAYDTFRLKSEDYVDHFKGNTEVNQSGLTPIDTIRLNLRNLKHKDIYRLNEQHNMKKVSMGWSYSQSKADKLLGKYKPRFFIGEFSCTVEFSAPKLIFGNNVQELLETDKETIIRLIRQHAENAGICLCHDFENYARVTRLDISKNISLSNGKTVAYLLNILKDVNVSERKDPGQINYNGGGVEVNIGNDSKESVFYDKLAELKAFKMNYVFANSPLKLPIVQKSIQENLEILRIEHRLLNGKAVSDEFENINIFRPKLADIFNSNLLHNTFYKVIAEILGNIDKGALEGHKTDIQGIQQLIAENKDNKLSDLAHSIAFETLKKSFTRKEIKQLLIPYFDKQQVGRFLKKLSAEREIGVEKINASGIFKDITEAIWYWRPFVSTEIQNNSEEK